jgi:hypothetical protein
VHRITVVLPHDLKRFLKACAKLKSGKVSGDEFLAFYLATKR